MDKSQVAAKLPPIALANPRLPVSPFRDFFPVCLKNASTHRNSAAVAYVCW